MMLSDDMLSDIIMLSYNMLSDNIVLSDNTLSYFLLLLKTSHTRQHPFKKGGRNFRKKLTVVSFSEERFEKAVKCPSPFNIHYTVPLRLKSGRTFSS
jgi:hypothetical protein